MLVPPTIPQPVAPSAIAAPHQAVKQPRGTEQVRTQTRQAVDSTERQEHSYRARARSEYLGSRVDILV